MRRVWWLPLLLLFVGLWAWLAPRPLTKPDAAITNAPPENEMGFTAMDAELIETGADGAPLYRLRAQRIAQSRPEAEVVLTAPRLSYNDQSAGTWTLQATSGTLRADRQNVAFSGAVQARRMQPHAAPLDVRTEALSVDLKLRHADTITPVNIEWGRARLSADGLHADMAAGTFDLKGNGHGRLQY